MALLQVASIRLLSSGLGQEGYGIYALLTGLVMWFTLADFGISTALQNKISEARAKNQQYEESIAIWSVVAMLLATLLAIVFWLAAPYLSDILLIKFIGIEKSRRILSLRAMGIFSITLASGSLIYKIWYGEQRGYLTHACQLLTTLSGYSAIWILIKFKSENTLEWSIISWYGLNAIIPVIFLLQRIRNITGLRQIKAKLEINSMIQSVFGFWIYGIMAAAVLQMDYVLIATLVGPADLITYNVFVRIFGLGFFLFTSVLSALWPILAERAAKNSTHENIRTILNHIFIGIAFVITFTIIVILTHVDLLKILSPSIKISPPPLFILAMGLYYCIRVWSDAFSVLLQSMGKLRSFYYTLPAQAAISVTGQYFGLRWIGLTGVPLGMAISFILTIAWVAPMYARSQPLKQTAES